MGALGTSHRIAFEAIGTRWEIDVFDNISVSEAENISAALKQRINTFDKTYSRFRSDSIIMRLAHNTGRVELPPDAKPLLEFYESLYNITEGKVTPLVGDILTEAGYDESYSLKKKNALSPARRWEDTFAYKAPFLTNSQKVILDFGAAGKGYVVDIIGSLLQDSGLNNYTIDAGGDMLHHTESHAPIRVGLEHPNDPSLVIGVVELKNESICGSAGNRRKWADLHHIIDPLSAKPVHNILASWVLADRAMLADGLATALFFTPAEVLSRHYRFNYVLVRDDMSVEYSKELDYAIFGANDE